MSNPQPPIPNPQSLTPNPSWYACVHLPPSPDPTKLETNTLVELAQDFSPRYQVQGNDLIVIDLSGLERLFGEPRQIGDALHRAAIDRGVRVQIAIAATRTAAKVLATMRPGVTVIERGDESRALAPIALGILDKLGDRDAAVKVLAMFTRWGLKTLGDLAALPSGELAARLGQQGLGWQRVARGQDVGPLVPMLATERFISSIDLEWPIEGLEPLSFVLTRLLEPLSTRLERQDRGAAALHVTLDLVEPLDIQRQETEGAGRPGKSGGSGGEDQTSQPHPAPQPHPAHPTHQPDLAHPASYARTLQLPAPIRDVRALRTLILLDLESHPPPAPIERVSIVIDPTPGRVLQHALFARAHPTPEQLSTLVARLNALMGEDRIGCPMLVDSHRPGAFGMAPFGIGGSSASSATAASVRIVAAVRRCRRPVPARVSVVGGRPAVVATDRRGFAGGQVIACAGPWRTSGQWWSGESGGSGKSGGKGREVLAHQPYQAHQTHQTCWNRDEWDVSLSDGAVYRIFQDRVTQAWFIDAIAD